MDEKNLYIFEPKEFYEKKFISIKTLDFIFKIFYRKNRLLHNQAQVFPFCNKKFAFLGYNNYAGLYYMKDGDGNPLKAVDLIAFRGYINCCEKNLNAIVEKNRNFEFGQVKIREPTLDSYLKVYDSYLNLFSGKLKFEKPNPINHFFINLSNDTFNKDIYPYLESKGYQSIERVIIS